MTTLHSTDRLGHKVRARTRTVITAVGAFIAVGVTIALLALTATSTPISSPIISRHPPTR